MGARPPAAPVLPVVSATPMAALPGASTDVAFAGDGLGKPVGLWTSFTAEAAVREGGDGGKIRYQLSVPTGVQVGIGAVRLMTSSGVSSLSFFMIDDLPTLPREAGKHAAIEARTLPEAGAVEGACEPLTSDFYAIEGKRGRRVSIEVVANRLGSRLDPVIRLIAPDGREAASCDDTPGIGADCMLAHTFEADGRYVLEVRDANYEGGARYFYRLRVGDFPLVTCAFPPAAKRGGEQRQFAFEGTGGTRIDHVTVELPEGALRVPIGLRYPGGMGSGFASILGAETDDFEAAEPNHQPVSAARIALPVAISGRFTVPGQKDYYAFGAKRGDWVLVRGQGRSIGSGCELEIALIGPDGRKVPEPKPPKDAKTLAADADVPPSFAGEGVAEGLIPADGEYRIVVRDLSNGAGTGLVYRLAAGRGGPDFSLAADSDKLDVPAAGAARIKVSCARREFAGRIRLSLKQTGGLEAGETFIEPGKNEGEIEVKAGEGGREKQPVYFTIVGNATIGGQEREHMAGTAGALQKVYPRMRFVPAELDGLIGAGVR